MLQIISILKFSSVCKFFFNLKLSNFVCGLKHLEKRHKFVCIFTKSVCKVLCFVFFSMFVKIRGDLHFRSQTQVTNSGSKLCKTFDGFINNVYLQSRQNIFIIVRRKIDANKHFFL